MSHDSLSLRFDPVQHRYWIGQWELLGVTRVLRDAGLVETGWWSEDARARGCRLHTLAEALDRGEGLHEFVDRKIPDDVHPRLEAYRRFLADARPVWQGIETPIADVRLGYAGTADRWGTLQGEDVVVDLKSGAVAPWAPLQLVAYARLLLDGRTVRRRRLTVQLLATGRYSLREYPVVNFGRDERIFLSALAIAQWKRAA